MKQWCRARRWRMVDVEADESLKRLARGRELEGYAFTFCKAAALALVLRRFTLIATSLAALICYVLAARAGVREWRCFVKPPWVVGFFGIVVTVEGLHLLRKR
jgi:Na+/H+ antiporter NhaD/arsenite permease-like protein